MYSRRYVYHLEEEINFRDDTVQLEVLAMHVFEEDFDDEGIPTFIEYLYEFRIYAYNEKEQDYNLDITDTLTDSENLQLQKDIDEIAADAAAYAAERKAER